MPMDSGNETPPVYDSPIYENHIFRNATDTEIHPGALMSTDNGHTAALQTLFHGAKRTKVFGGLIGSNLSDAAKANYEEKLSVPYAEKFLALSQEDLELRKEEAAIRREELALQKVSDEKASRQALYELALRREQIDVQRQRVAYDFADEPNERSHLIPATSQPEPVIPIEVDPKEATRTRLHAQMAKVVKSKESKMVNISARLPFNLRNQDLGAPSLSYSRLAQLSDPSSSTSSPSPAPHTSPPPFPIPGPANSSKNANGSLFAFASPSSATPHSHGEVQAQVGGPLTAIGATAQLPGVVSRSPSRSSRAREFSSDALLSPGDDDDAVGTERDRDGSSNSRAARREPLLGVRLVRGPPIDEIKPWLQIDSVAGSPNGKGKSPAQPLSLRGSPAAGPSPSPSYISLRGRAKRRGTSISSSLRGGFGTGTVATSGSGSLGSTELEAPGADDLGLTLDTTAANVTTDGDGDDGTEVDTDLHTPTIGALAQTPRPGYFVSPPPLETSAEASGSQREASPALKDTDSTASVDRGRIRDPAPLVLQDTEPLIVDWDD
ncbi:hypothetical protein D9619_002285 [Psilocybe cf. subviscida]|uniref:Uncharacterized protein n=1 Tax=Psilocybe cf. subviscida TaxID=2480587 RepID=A0A8H5BFI3_9AGAR|nr:hypothetical protein D9619_002285 [Psilocybe cf. subviscida]